MQATECCLFLIFLKGYDYKVFSLWVFGIGEMYIEGAAYVSNFSELIVYGHLLSLSTSGDKSSIVESLCSSCLIFIFLFFFFLDMRLSFGDLMKPKLANAPDGSARGSVSHAEIWLLYRLTSKTRWVNLRV